MFMLAVALSIRLAPNPPSLDVFGSGPFTNVGGGDEQAWTNAVAHVWFGSMCPLAGYYVDGRRGFAPTFFDFTPFLGDDKNQLAV